MLLLHEHGGEEVTNDGETIEGSPAYYICHEDAHEYQDCLSAAAKALPDLLSLETRDCLEPEFLRDPGIAQCHGNHWTQKLNAKDEEEVGLVVDLLVNWPDLTTEDLLLVLDNDENCFCCEVG